MSESDRVVALTLTVARRAEAHDIFPGGCDDGALCWFILKRIPIAIANNQTVCGPFQFVPYASAINDFPPDDEMTYRDEAGNWARGIALYIGRVTLVNKPSESRRGVRSNAEIASGRRFTTDLDQARRATATLDKIDIQLHE